MNKDAAEISEMGPSSREGSVETVDIVEKGTKYLGSGLLPPDGFSFLMSLSSKNVLGIAFDGLEGSYSCGPTGMHPSTSPK